MIDATTTARLAVRVPIEATWRLTGRWRSARAVIPTLPSDPRDLAVTLDAADLGRLEAFSPSQYWALDLNYARKLVDAPLPLVAVSREDGKGLARLARVLMGIHGERRARTAVPLNGDPLDLRRANLRIVSTSDLRAQAAGMQRPRLAEGEQPGGSLNL